MSNIYEKLLNIQTKLNAPKNQYNKYGDYNFRNCEDILNALKPLLDENKCTLYISDDIVQIGNRYYIKTVVTLIDIESEAMVFNTGWAREEEQKKSFDVSQITGAASSYARKYALNGLFILDDVRDADTPTGDENKNTSKNENKNKNKVFKLTAPQKNRLYAIAYKHCGFGSDQTALLIQKKYNVSIDDLKKDQYNEICNALESNPNQIIEWMKKNAKPQQEIAKNSNEIYAQQEFPYEEMDYYPMGY